MKPYVGNIDKEQNKICATIKYNLLYESFAMSLIYD